MTHKQTYRDFCEGRTDMPLFMEPFWLDMLCTQEGWEASITRNDAGHVAGAWAYATGSSKGHKWLRLPSLTPFTGIWMEPQEELPPSKILESRHAILDALIDQLPPAQITELKLHWSLDDWLPFYWRGYHQETRYTFRFDEVEPERILEGMSKSSRRNLRAAERHYAVTECSPRELHAQMDKVFDMRDAENPISTQTLEHVLEVLGKRQQCKTYAARDAEGIQASILCVWDHHTTYYLIGGRQKTDSKQGMLLLLWQALLDTAQRKQSFDFEGSMIQGVNRFFQTFGATLTPYFYLYKYSGLARLKYLR